jgi:cytoskeletal protein RodZ
MATRRKRNLNFLPAESRAETVIDISAYPVDIGVGELMRLTRERLGHELQTVANQLRIRLSYLEAIEDARFRDLPGTTYAVGFVRSYADYLGLDGADIVRRFREEAARIHGQTKLVFPALTAEGKLPRAAVLLVSAVGLAAVYGVWYYISSNQHSDLPVITDVPDRLAVQAPDSGSDGAASDRLIQQSAPEEPQASSPTAGESRPTTPSAEPSMPAAPADGVTGTASAATPIEPAGGGTAASPSPPAAPAAAPPAESAPATDIAASTANASPTPSPPDVPSSSQAPAVSSDSAIGSSGGAGQPSPAAPVVAPVAPVAEPAPPVAPVAPVAESAPPVAPAAPVAESAPPVAPVAPVAAPAPPAAPAVADNEIPAAPAAPAIPGQDASPQIAAAPPAGDAQGVVLEARMECWIKVVDAKGKTVTQKVLKAGESYAVPDQPGLVLRTGNAGGLDVIVGGRKAPALGDVGTVLSKVLLEPSRLLDGTAVTN